MLSTSVNDDGFPSTKHTEVILCERCHDTLIVPAPYGAGAHRSTDFPRSSKEPFAKHCVSRRRTTFLPLPPSQQRVRMVTQRGDANGRAPCPLLWVGKVAD